MPKILVRIVSTLSILVATYALIAYAAWPLGAVLHPDVRPSFAAHPAVVLYAHVFAAAVALLVGPLQFSSRLRTRWPGAHRWLGLIYLGVGVLIGGVSGALLAWQAYGGPWSRAGFMTLALAWLASGGVALLKIRRGEVEAHRRWMIRNFGLSLAAVSLRLSLPALVAGGVPMPVAYPLVAWLCWLPQAAWIEWRLAGGASAAALRRWAAGALALTLLSGCGAIQPARMSLPAELAAGSERIELRGLGAGTQGSAPVLGRTLSFERSASRLSLFDDLVRTDRSALHWRWGETDTVRADCRSRRRSNTVGIVDIVGRPLEIDCRFEPDGARLTLAETRTSTRTLTSERRGEFVLGNTRWTVRSLHRPEGAAIDVAQPLGYVVEEAGRAFAAVEQQGTRPVLHLPPANDPRRSQVLPGLLALALLWDESGS